jgi:hypothetical protein
VPLQIEYFPAVEPDGTLQPDLPVPPNLETDLLLSDTNSIGTVVVADIH